MADSQDQKDQASEAVGELLLGLLISLFAVFVIVEAARMPIRGHLGIVMSPGFVPLFTGILLLALSLVIDIRALRLGGHKQLGRWLNKVSRDEENRRLLVILACLGLYVLVLVGRINFIAATLIYHILIFIYLKVGGPLKIGFFALLATGLVSLFLPGVFEMPIP